MKGRIRFIFVFLLLGTLFFIKGNDHHVVVINKQQFLKTGLEVSSGDYLIKDKFIKKIPFQVNGTDFLNSFQINSGKLELKCDNSTNFVGTGCYLRIFENEIEQDAYETVVQGDITGDGVGTLTDIVRIVMLINDSKKNGLDTEVNKLAADVDYNDSISLDDAIILGQYILEDKELPKTPSDLDNQDGSIEISTTSISLEKGSTKKIDAKLSGNISIVEWKSENPSIASVDSSGVVTGVSGGVTKILVTASNGATASVEVTVKVNVDPTGITLNASTIELNVGDTKNLIATVSPNDATDKSIKWESSDSNIVTVDSKGNIIGKAVGKATVTAITVNGLSASAQVEVKILTTGITLSKTSLSLEIGDTQTLTATITPTNASNKAVTWASSDTSVVSVTGTGVIKAIGSGTATITVTTVDSNKQATCKVTVIQPLITQTNFSKIKQCASNTTVKTVDGVNMHLCINDFSLVDEHRHFQDFAITDDYIYFTSPLDGAWTTEAEVEAEEVKNSELQRVSRTYVVRINRNTSTYQLMYLNYAGHAQSFDVANQYVTDSNGNQVDQIYANAFAYLTESSSITRNGVPAWGASYRGVLYCGFSGSSSIKGNLKYPGTSVAVAKDGKSLKLIQTSSYKFDNVFDPDAYYKDVINIGLNENYMFNPELGVDEKNNHIVVAQNSSKTAYIYNLSDFKKGIATLEYTVDFSETSSKQGVELYQNYLYFWSGGTGSTFVLRKYDITTNKLVKSVELDMASYYEEKDRKSQEAEGISVYDGKIYVGAVNRATVDGKTRNYIDIFLLEGV